MPKSYYNFPGGEKLTHIGACWFVSYMYCTYVDSTHLNWQKASNHSVRLSICNKNSTYHKVWIKEIVDMTPEKLQTNELGLTGNDVIKMAKVLYDII